MTYRRSKDDAHKARTWRDFRVSQRELFDKAGLPGVLAALTIRGMGIAKDRPKADRVPLESRRSLIAKERALIEFLLVGPFGRDELRLQARTAEVDAVCSCGCPSVWLWVDAATPAADFKVEETEFGRTDWVPITAFQQKAKGSTEVTLHVVHGRLAELEIWAGEYGVRPRIDLAKLKYEPRQSE